MAQKTKSEPVVTVVSEAISVRRPIRQAAPLAFAQAVVDVDGY
jgi:hypothetical protein